MKDDPHHKSEGIWQFEKSVPAYDCQGKVVNDTVTFVYCNGMVTLRLLTLGLGQWKTKDDFYQLSAKWEADTLFYLPPFGHWTELAVFEHGRFVNTGNGIKRYFKRISEQEIVDWNKNITAVREPHNYRIKPDGGANL